MKINEVNYNMDTRKWEDLERDCLVKVFEKVGLKSLIFDVPCVCKAWYAATLVPDCWKSLDFEEFESEECLDFLRIDLMEDCNRYPFIPLMKFAVDRSLGTAIMISLPSSESEEMLEYISDSCPSLKILKLYFGQVQDFREPCISKYVGKWKDLEILIFSNIGSSFEELITEISVKCNKFLGFETGAYLGLEKATAIVASLPKIKHLGLRMSFLPREVLMVILTGCRELELLDVSECLGFEADDEEILKMASHIKKFISEGASIYGNIEDW